MAEASMSDKSDRIVIFVDDWTCYRDYVRGQVVREILRRDPNVDVVLASKFQIESLPEDLQTERVRVYHVHSPKPRLFSKVIYGIAKSLYIAEHPKGTLAIKQRVDAINRGRYFNLRLSLAMVLKKLGLRSDRVARRQQCNVRPSDFGDLLDRERPSCVLYTCVIPFKAECLKEAKRRRIPLILAFSFWDQATSKGPLAVEPEYVLSWSDEMSREISEHHFISERKIRTCGVLYFDPYFQAEGRLARESFCHSLGVDPKKKIILYGMGDSRTLKCNLPFLETLGQMVANDELGFPAHLLVRVSPKDDYSLYYHLSGDEHLTIAYPKGTHEALLNRWLPDPDEDIDRVNQILHSAVVVCVSSTLILDSLCLHKPIVNLGYDAGGERPYHDSVRRFFDYTHAKPVLEEGGTWIVRDRTELRDALRGYLQCPETHSEERQKLLQRIVKYTDGRSFLRWSDTIVAIANGPENSKSAAC